MTLADIGALNAFGYDRRAALWQVPERGAPSGELFAEGVADLHGGTAESWTNPAGRSVACLAPLKPKQTERLRMLVRIT